MRSLTLLVLFLTACSGEMTPPDAGPSCAEPSGTTPHAGSITASETWAASTTHALSNDFTISAGASVTIEPCAKVTISAGHYLYVYGTLTARGEASKPISIKADSSGRFASIHVRAPGSADLAYVTVSGGGGTPQSTWGANIIVEGQWPVVRSLKVDHVTIDDAAGYGIAMRSYGAFTDDSTELTVTNSGKTATQYPFPLRMSANTLRTLPVGHYTGNQVDEIQIVGENPHYQTEVDDTIHDRGVPYRVGFGGPSNELRVGAVGSVPTLTIEAGVTIRIDDANAQGRVYVGVSNSTGQLIAVGTASKPIIFTTAKSPATNGAWIGVDFANPVAAGNRMEFTRIEYAGGPGGASGYGCLPLSLNRDDASLRVFSQPGSAFFKDSTIAHSLGHGMLSAWIGAQVDFKASNLFDDIASGGCDQVAPKPPVPASCPSSPTCQ